ncbi:polyketide cyclase/dehydrase [Leptospira ryugenii]|uniref:Polyketide cyclase/dehydrase n=1 Tax=Leptospira ryugenii TaxID=1917863 RepID=A0A2P2E3Q0_9LEPT|nr:outer membrane lipoprotein-sorting protein [Leptospira ryugenii]GBF51456.1 polyketide cyclase/dehydrase [Leptospira ryugenii]
MKNQKHKIHNGHIVLGASIWLSLVFGNIEAQEKIDLNKLVEKSNQVLKVSGSVSESTFILTDKNGQERKRKTISYTKLANNGIDNTRSTKFLSPADAKGTGILLVENHNGEDDISLYLPALKKVRKIAAGGKKDSFVGTDFSYADVVGFKTDDWVYKNLGDTTISGKICYTIEATPKSEKTTFETGYSKRVLKIQKDNFITLAGEAYDENGDLIKKFAFSDYQLVEPNKNKWWSMKAEVQNVQTGHKTVILTENFKVEPELEDKYFSTRFLERD